MPARGILFYVQIVGKHLFVTNYIRRTLFLMQLTVYFAITRET